MICLNHMLLLSFVYHVVSKIDCVLKLAGYQFIQLLLF